jgi:putative transcriptional regulator
MTTAATNALRARRLERNLTQADLSDRLQVSVRTIRAIETGRYAPSVTLACRIARILGQPVESLFRP